MLTSRRASTSSICPETMGLFASIPAMRPLASAALPKSTLSPVTTTDESSTVTTGGLGGAGGDDAVTVATAAASAAASTTPVGFSSQLMHTSRNGASLRDFTAP